MKKYYFKSTLMGLLFGFAAKMVDLFPGNTMIGFLGFKDLLNNLGIFIVAICFIEYYSNCIKAGIANSLCFMVSMVISYYCVTLWFFHDFPFRYAALWCLVALCSPLLYLSISLRRKTGYIAILGTLIPNLLLGGEAYKFIHTDCYSNRALWFDIIAIIVIFWKLPMTSKNRACSILGFIALIPFLNQMDVITQIARYLYSILL